jgi:hypothetical protein
MSQLWCPGDCRIYLGFVTPGYPSQSTSNSVPASVNNANAKFLGWCEEAPEIDVQQKWVPVFTDVGGNQVPTDKSWQREIGFIGMSLSQFNRFPYYSATYQPRPATSLAGVDNPAFRGLASPGDVGTLMLTEGQAIVIYVQFPYAVKPAMGGGAGPPAGMEQGYRFFAGTLEGFDPGPTGTKPQIVTMAWECLGYQFLGNANAYGSVYYQLYDGNLSGLPAVN